METDRLKYFCTIVETGSLSRASEILNVSHSGLSKALSLLQKEVNIQLVRPQGRGLEITPQGKLFYQRSLEVLAMVDRLSVEVQEQEAPIGIGMSEVVALPCAGLLAHELAIPLKLKQSGFGDMEEDLLNEQINFGFGFVPRPHPEIEYLKIGKVTFNAYAREDLISRSNENIPFAVPILNLPANPMGYKVRDGWPRGVKRNTVCSVNNFGIALNLMRTGSCAAYLPDFAANQESESLKGRYKIVKVPFHSKAQTQRELFLMKLKNEDESRIMKKATKLIRKTCCR